MSTFTDTTEALGVAIAANQPVILWGAPGQGKTSAIQAIADQQGRLLRTVLASIREPSDFAGLPDIVDGRTRLIAPDWAYDLEEAKNGILFLDEVSTAPLATQAALLRPVCERVVGNVPLPKDTAVVAAANPTSQAADGWDLSMPMANRFTHLDWQLPATVVRDGFTIGWPEIQIPTADEAAVEREVRQALLLVAAFVDARPDMATRTPDVVTADTMAYPTPRSWEAAATLYGFATAAGVSANARRLLMVGTVGQGATGEFLTYVSELDLPNPEEVMAAPDKWEVPARRDRVYAVGASVLSVVQQDLTEKRWKMVGGVVARIATEGQSDVAVALGRRWIAMREKDTWLPDPATLRVLAPTFREAKIF